MTQTVKNVKCPKIKMTATVKNRRFAQIQSQEDYQKTQTVKRTETITGRLSKNTDCQMHRDNHRKTVSNTDCQTYSIHRSVSLKVTVHLSHPTHPRGICQLGESVCWVFSPCYFAVPGSTTAQNCFHTSGTPAGELCWLTFLLRRKVRPFSFHSHSSLSLLIC